MEVEAGIEVDYQQLVLRHATSVRAFVPGAAARRRGDEDVAALGLDRHVDAAHAANRFGPWPGGVHHQRRGDVAARGLDLDDPVAVQANAGDLGVTNHLCALRLRALGKAHGHAVWVGHAVSGAVGRALHAGHIETGRQRLGLGGGKPLHVHAARLLQLDVLEEGGHVRGLGEQEEVAVLVKVDRRTDHFLEPRHHGDRLERQVDIGGMRELVAHPPGIPASGTRGELCLAFEQDDVGQAQLGQVPRYAGAHAPATDNYGICCVLHEGDLNLSDRP